MCIYDRNAYDCGHQEWGAIKGQCTQFWRKCSIRTGHESFAHQLPGLCHTCQVRRPNDRDIAADDSIHITIQLKPSMAIERAVLESAKGRAVNTADLPTPGNVKSYLTSCVKRYQQAHNLPEDSVKISEVDCTPNANVAGSRATGDAYHQHSCGLSHSNCKRLDDYQIQLMLLEYQNKRRLMMARGEVDAAGTAPKQPNAIPSPEEIRFRHCKFQDYQRELMREASHAKKEQPTLSTPGHGGIIPPVMSQPPKPSNEKAMKDSAVEDFQKQNEQAMKNLCLEDYQKQLTALRWSNHQRDKLQF